jgi:hypothetical protein
MIALIEDTWGNSGDSEHHGPEGDPPARETVHREQQARSPDA